MKKPLIMFGIFLLIIFLFLLGLRFYYYPGRYQPPSAERPSLEKISPPPTEIKIFSDVYEQKRGTVLLDLTHNNNFELKEFYLLTLRITSRGYSFEYLKKSEDLEEKLRYVDALIIILPQDEFSSEEAKLIKEFKEKGGKLLLVSDPTRPGEINSIASEFGLIFEDDYLYNLKENDGNFRYIYLANFKSDLELTKDLEKITLYSASSISPSEWGIVFTDENTFSSIVEAKKKLSPIVSTPDWKVLAISDFTFMVEPYNLSTDNNQFISNLADWLTQSERVFDLSDFPYFFGDEIQIAYVNTAYLDIGLKLKNLLTDLGKSPKLTQYKKTISKDLIFIGLFDEAEKTENLLKKGEITINEIKIKIGGIGEINRKGTSILSFDKKNNTLIALSDTKERLGESIERLVNGKFRDWLVTNTISVHQVE